MPRLERLFDRYRRRGDPGALARVFDRTAPEVLRVAFHLAREAADAEDLLQQTFVTAIENSPRFDASRRLVPWLLGILSNHARTLARWRGRAPRTGTDAAGVGAVRAASPVDVPLEWSAEIASAVDALGDPYRETLILRYRHGLEPAEIADLLRRPPATVRSHLHRGLARLRERLEPRTAATLPAALPLVGLALVRERVLAHAAAWTPTAGAGGAAALALGGSLVTKKTLALAALLVLLPLGVVAVSVSGILSRDDGDRGPPDLRAERAPEEGAEAPPAAVLEGRGVAEVPVAFEGDVPEREDAATAPGEDVPPGKGNVRGRVRFADGRPFAGRTLELWGTPAVRVVTDDEGRFLIRGDWVADRALHVVRDDPDGYTVCLADVSMRADETVEVDVTVEEGRTWRGRVVSARDGAPVEGARVTLRRPGAHATNVMQAGFAFAKSDAEGAFRLELLPEAAYTLEVAAQGFEAYAAGFDLQAEPAPAEIRLPPARTLVFHLENAPAAALATTVMWMLQRQEGDLSLSGRGTIDERGDLRVDAPPAGRYHVLLFETPHLPRLEALGATVGDGDRERIVLRVPSVAPVAGTLLAADGTPLADARVSLGKASSVATDAEGRFSFSWVPVGTSSLWIHEGEAKTLVAEVTVGGPAAGPLVVRVTGTARIVAVARTRGGAPAGVVSLLRAEGRRPAAEARPDAHGRFAMSHLEAGAYVLSAWAFGADVKTLELRLAAGQTLDLGTILLESYPRLAVTFRLPPGTEPPPSLVVTGNPDASPPPAPDAWPNGRIEVDGEGRHWLTGLRAGRHAVRILAEGFEPLDLTLEVTPEAVVPDVLELVPIPPR
jgi:RNA polymerase sigma-70 factor (ECF subfamily)